MTQAGLKFRRRCLDNLSQEHIDFRFEQIILIDFAEIDFDYMAIIAMYES